MALGRKECYRPNFKPRKDPSKGISRQNICHSREPGTFSPERNEACSYLINRVICKKISVKDKKQRVFEIKKAQKLESLERILTKTAVLLEALLQKNCENFPVCHPKNWRSSYPKSSTWKAEICHQQISIITIIRVYLTKSTRCFSRWVRNK